MQAMSCSRDGRAIAGQSQATTQAKAHQLWQSVAADEAELLRLPAGAVEAAQALALQRNGCLRAHGRSWALLKGVPPDAAYAQPKVPPQQALAHSDRTDANTGDPLQVVLAAEFGRSIARRHEGTPADIGSPETAPGTNGPSEMPQLEVSPLPLPAQRGWFEAANLRAAHAVQPARPEAEWHRSSNVPSDSVSAASPNSAGPAAAWQEPVAGSPRSAVSEAACDSSQWSDSGSESSSSSAWSEMSVDGGTTVAYKTAMCTALPVHQLAVSAGDLRHPQQAEQPGALAADRQRSAVAAVGRSSRNPDADKHPVDPGDSTGQAPDTFVAASMPLTRASLLKVRHPDDNSPGKASWQHGSSGSLRVEAVSEQGLSSDDEGEQPSRLLPPGLLGAWLPLAALASLASASAFPPPTSVPPEASADLLLVVYCASMCLPWILGNTHLCMTSAGRHPSQRMAAQPQHRRHC